MGDEEYEDDVAREQEAREARAEAEARRAEAEREDELGGDAEGVVPTDSDEERTGVMPPPADREPE